MMSQRRLLILLGLFWLTSVSASEPGDKKITLSGSALQAQYQGSMSVKEFESLFELVTIDAYNPWEKRSDSYTGVWLDRLAEQLGEVKADKLILAAIDNYQITFTRKEWTDHQLLLATRVNGEHQPVREKGPMRIIYASYDASRVEDGLTLAKWIWMVTKVELSSAEGGE